MTMPTKRVMTPDEATLSLKARFAVTEDARENYSGLMVAPDGLLDVATALKDEMGFNYLSSVTAVDLIKEEKLEVVYHIYNLDAGGGPVALKVQIPRDGSQTIPSLTPIVLNRMPTSPASLTPSFTFVANSSRCMLQGLPSHPVETIPTCAFFKSLVVRPIACNIACAAGNSSFCVSVLLYLFNLDILGFNCSF